MFSESLGVIVSTPRAKVLMDQIDKAINTFLREQLLADKEGFLEKIRGVARTMLDSGHAPAVVKQKLDDVMLKDMGLDGDEELKRKVANIVEQESKKR
jgi:hypothetical protein